MQQFSLDAYLILFSIGYILNISSSGLVGGVYNPPSKNPHQNYMLPLPKDTRLWNLPGKRKRRTDGPRFPRTSSTGHAAPWYRIPYRAIRHYTPLYEGFNRRSPHRGERKSRAMRLRNGLGEGLSKDTILVLRGPIGRRESVQSIITGRGLPCVYRHKLFVGRGVSPSAGVCRPRS